MKKIIIFMLLCLLVGFGMLFLYLKVLKWQTIDIKVVDALTGGSMEDIEVLFGRSKYLGQMEGSTIEISEPERKVTDKSGSVNLRLEKGIGTKSAPMFVVNGDDHMYERVDAMFYDVQSTIHIYRRTKSMDMGVNYDYFPSKYIVCNSDKNMFCEGDDFEMLKFLGRRTKKIEVQLIPKLDSIDQCKLISDTVVKEDCIALNAYYNAVRNEDEELCKAIKDSNTKEDCEERVEKAIIYRNQKK